MPTLSGKAALDAATKLNLNPTVAGLASLQRADDPTPIPISGTVTISLALAAQLDDASMGNLSMEITDDQAAQLAAV